VLPINPAAPVTKILSKSIPFFEFAAPHADAFDSETARGAKFKDMTDSDKQIPAPQR
jgi:hypothetical protein